MPKSKEKQRIDQGRDQAAQYLPAEDDHQRVSRRRASKGKDTDQGRKKKEEKTAELIGGVEGS